ncbi:MAG: phosphoribosyltransferase family protein [Candidatus Anstonellales archaeon]
MVKEFGKDTGIPYKRILRRKRDTKQQHTMEKSEDRYENVKDSISVDFDVSGKNILVFDNVCISGATFDEVLSKLKKAGANKVIFFCLGLGSKAKESDFDINKNFKHKASHIIENWHWPKVPKAKRISRK